LSHLAAFSALTPYSHHTDKLQIQHNFNVDVTHL
jgi:hypothetical protein